MRERLQRALARAGLGSRRRCEDLIRCARVTVDGVVAHLGMAVDLEEQDVRVDGRPVQVQPREYWLLNKPAGVLSTVSDSRGRRTVVDCVPTKARIFPVGRLDYATTGALVLTNDGDLAYRLLHPRYGVDKEYRVVAAGRIQDKVVRALRRGVRLEDGLTAPARVEVLSVSDDKTELTMTIREGKKRQIRRMLEAVGHPVLGLHRVRFDGLSVDGLALGESRLLSEQEIQTFREAVERP